MAQKFNAPFEFVREDDFVEYYIFPQFSAEIINEWTDAKENTKERLQQLKSECLQFVDKLVKDCQYIWHKDKFQLQVRTCSKEEEQLLLFGGKNESPAAAEEPATTTGRATGTKRKVNAPVPLPPHLYGVTHYGDNITDEWFIVFLLREITKHFHNVVVRVVDADGEFLLIEAAYALPKWANPDTCEQRVYIANGGVHLIQNSPTNTKKILPVAKALEKLYANPTLYRLSEDMENCIEERLKDFKLQKGEKLTLLHHEIVRAPVGVAALLKARPDLIAPAVRAFCDRDTIDMKACRSMLYFPPEQRVRINVCFTRCLYAMLIHNNYKPDKKIGWNLNGNQSSTKEFKEDLLGIKLACGFEILASQAKQTEDNGNGDVNGLDVKTSPAWKTYKNSLEVNGYFRNELVGSQEYQRLLNQAEQYFRETQLSYRSTSEIGNEILQLLKTLDINVEALKNDEINLKESDDDNWLNITAEELDEMLIKRYGVKKLYKTNGHINAAEFTNNIAEFLEKQSHMEGITKNSNSNSDTNTDDDDDAGADDDDSSSNEKPMPKRIGKRFKHKEQQEQQRIKIKKNLSMRRACRKQNNSSDNNSSLDNTLPDGASGKEESFTQQMRNSLNFTLPEDLWDFNSDSDMDIYGVDDNDSSDDNGHDDNADADIEGNFPKMKSTLHNEEDIDKDIKAYMDEMDRELAKTTIGQTFSNRQQRQQYSHNNDNDDDDDFNDIENFEPIDINVSTLKNLMDSYKSQLGGTGPVTHLLNAMGAGMSTAGNNEAQDDDNEHGGTSCNLNKNKEKNLTESRV